MEAPASLRLEYGKNGKPKHSPSCRTCKAKVGHRVGCKAYAATLERLLAWRQYETWRRATIGDAAFFANTLPRQADPLPYPTPVCTVCGETNYPTHTRNREPRRDGYGYEMVEPTAGHAFIEGLTPGLHPASNESIQYGPATVFRPALVISDDLKDALRAADDQARAIPRELDATIYCPSCGWSYSLIEASASVKAEHDAARFTAKDSDVIEREELAHAV